jgi:hypothetical protein
MPRYTQLHQGPSFKIYYLGNLSFSSKFLLYIISNQNYSIYIYYYKCYRAPNYFLVNTRFSIRLDKSKPFDYFIKMEIPTLERLLQSINGSLKFAYLLIILRINNTFGLHHVQLFHNIIITERYFHIHLPNFIIEKCSTC